MDFELTYPPELKKIAIIDKSSYEIRFKALFETKKGKFHTEGSIGRIGDIVWKDIPSPYAEILTQVVQSSSYIEDLIKPFQEVGNEGEGQNY